jgi:hypothetical protein
MASSLSIEYLFLSSIRISVFYILSSKYYSNISLLYIKVPKIIEVNPTALTAFTARDKDSSLY